MTDGAYVQAEEKMWQELREKLAYISQSLLKNHLTAPVVTSTLLAIYNKL